MKNFRILFCLALLCPVFAAADSPEKAVLALPELMHESYDASGFGGKQLYLEMRYGSPVIRNPKALDALEGAMIACVDLVYTDHPAGMSFDQLTDRRVKHLKSLKPDIFQAEGIKWRRIRQTQAQTQDSAEEMFHGFVITYRPETTVDEEIAYLESLFEPGEEVLDAEIFESYSLTISVDPFTYEVLDTISYTLDTSAVPVESYWTDFVPPVFQDSTVLSALRRNEWNNPLIVSDVTGSMAPYTGQLFTWFRLTMLDKQERKVVYFNDGDNAPDHSKRIGATGGIHDIRSSEYATVRDKAYFAMRKGGGGDGPENDMEAVLEAIEKYPEHDEVILIADNWASVKDLTLLKQVDRPVRVILCGAGWGVNIEYLEIARQTGGSVHLMEQDLLYLSELHEGETFEIGNELFEVRKGRIVNKGSRS